MEGRKSLENIFPTNYNNELKSFKTSKTVAEGWYVPLTQADNGAFAEFKLPEIALYGFKWR